MTASFRISADDLRTWHDAAAARSSMRGVAAVASELDVHLKRVGDDGHAVVDRHRLFTWAQALQGAHTRDPRTASAGAQLSLQQVADDMNAVLAGRAGAAGPAPQPRASEAPGLEPGPPLLGEPDDEPVAPVQYVKPAPGSAAGRGTVEFVAGHAIQEAVRRLLRDAQAEVRVVSPWTPGLDALAPELVALAPQVQVRIVSRRPEREDAEYHRLMTALGRRRAVTAFSPLLMTRMVIQDRAKALIGAASLHPPSFTLSREAALLTTDPPAVARAVDHFDRVHAEASGGSARP